MAHEIPLRYREGHRPALLSRSNCTSEVDVIGASTSHTSAQHLKKTCKQACSVVRASLDRFRGPVETAAGSWEAGSRSAVEGKG